eukprot:Nitzschia sp. Nitz4//scaffold251_size28233//17903//21114//NITZ4_008134-RA/size28233-augustus-gene-0.12-mRNA-1//1//CDS//3329544244//5667//frame0
MPSLVVPQAKDSNVTDVVVDNSVCLSSPPQASSGAGLSPNSSSKKPRRVTPQAEKTKEGPQQMVLNAFFKKVNNASSPTKNKSKSIVIHKPTKSQNTSKPQTKLPSTKTNTMPQSPPSKPQSSPKESEETPVVRVSVPPQDILQSLGSPESPRKPVPALSKDHQDLLQKYAALALRYEDRSKEIVASGKEGLDEEDFGMPELESCTVRLSQEDDFPDAVLRNMAAIIEGSSQPLSKLVLIVMEKLDTCHSHRWTEVALSTRIKTMADRKPFLDNVANFKSDVQAKYEDQSDDRFWRWEVTTLEILPETILSKVRKARSARRRLLNHYMANHRLVQSLREAITNLEQGSVDSLSAVQARITKDEEKVLKFERDAEKQRLAQQAKRKKEMEAEAKRREKELAAEEKRKEKERKLESIQEKKRQATEAKELEKQKKEEEKERQVQERQCLLNKQKATFKSFFSNPKRKNSDSADSSQVSQSPVNSKNDFDSAKFRSLWNSTADAQPLFPSLSKSADASRKRRTRKVPVSVFITVESNGFDAQPFAEQQTVHVPNKYRFLSFYEDCRPAYHGTWSKTSTIITGRTPFAKDSAYLDYDYDSEAEWEEGDDEIGEDVDDDAKNQEEDEDGDAKMYDFDDGFCVADDHFLDTEEDVDDETKELYKKQLQRGEHSFNAPNRMCLISPAAGGLPADSSKFEVLMEGFGESEAVSMTSSLRGIQLSDEPLWLDAFPPDLLEEQENDTDSPSAAPGNGDKGFFTKSEMIRLARFVHNSTVGSKEKLIDDLREAHPGNFGNRARTIRTLDAVATKTKSASGAVWEVNPEVLEELGLHELKTQQPVEITEHAELTDHGHYAKEEMVQMVKFVHHSTCNSKEKLIDELRSSTGSFGSRARALRKLDAIADKVKHPSGTGAIWEVKEDVLRELKLTSLLANQKTSGGSNVRQEQYPKSPPPNEQLSSVVSGSKKAVEQVVKLEAGKKLTFDKAPTTPRTPTKRLAPETAADCEGKVNASAKLMMNFLMPRKKPKKSR